MRTTLLPLFAAVSIVGCTKTATVTINASDLRLKENCFPLKVENEVVQASREMEIVENTLSDTVALGYAVLAPTDRGNRNYLRTGEGGPLYAEPGQSMSEFPKTSEVCIDWYLGKQERKPNRGKVVIRFKY